MISYSSRQHVSAEQCLKGFVPLALLLTGSLDRGDFHK
jgi:hypothetical protein